MRARAFGLRVPDVLAATLLTALVATTAACSGDADPSGGGAPPGGGHGAAAGGTVGGGGSGAAGTGGSGGTTSSTTTAGGSGGSGASGGAGGTAPEWGQLGGTCGEIDEPEIVSPNPFLFQNAIDFGTQAFDYDMLSLGGKQVWDDDNAGGSSLYSEVLAFEVLHRCEQAELLKTETYIEYDPPDSTMTDILVEIDGYKVGVSVVRAFHYPPTDPYTLDQALAKMEEKLLDIQESSANVVPADAWTKQILHVIAWDAAAAATVETAVGQLDASVKGDTIVVVTATHGTDEYIYFE